MADKLDEIAETLFRGFLAPLVLGGSMTPANPIGARAALALGETGEPADATSYGVRPLGDPEKMSHVQLARVRVARRLVAVDRFDGLTKEEWALAAALHDIVQSTHPDLPGMFRANAPSDLLAMAVTTIERVSPPRDVHEALARHTWFSRIFEIARTDMTVSWWVGSRTFLGKDPPARLTAWPELRRVETHAAAHALVDLPPPALAEPHANAIRAFLSRTPLTDLATCDRPAPLFTWSNATLAFVSHPIGRTLALRAMACAPASAVDAALARSMAALGDDPRADVVRTLARERATS